ncbi:hypothetical protein BJ170DRAFT_611062 [Xylariales sp. AK1849]|nr:hypothetical protein BJ170DRAFT_611062 [Xylariales sp. AK1849]
MSLGVKSVWRVPACISVVNGLSMIPRDLRGLPLYRSGTVIRHESTSSTEPCELIRHVRSSNRRIPQPAPRVEERRAPKLIKGSPSSVRRESLRRVVKQRAELGTNISVLVRPEARYASKHESRESRRRNRKSAARQDLWAHTCAAEEKPETDWRLILDVLSKLTPAFGTIYNFRVAIGRGVPAEVRKLLPGSDTSIKQIQWNTRCIIRFDEVNEEDGVLNITLSGSEHSVRSALVDLLKAVGQFTAIRVMDSDSKDILLDLWQRDNNPFAPVHLLEKGDTRADDNVLTLRREHMHTKGHPAQARHPYYMLTVRADAITRPPRWTRTSLESYVAALVYGVIPAHLHFPLYKNGGSDHQQTVVSLLMDLFHSEHTRPALSTKTLAMALSYVQDKNLTFRSAARAIFNQAEIYNIPMDTRLFNLFLRGSVRSGDLAGFHTILKMMTRKGFYPDSETWLLFLRMIEDVAAKRVVLRRMKRKGLDRIQSTLVKAGRHMAPYELDIIMRESQSIDEFLEYQDKVYGPRWLDVTTVNRMINILGRRGRRDLCDKLLDIVAASNRATPDLITLNTMMSHSRDFQDIVSTIKALQSRWPSIVLGEDTYHMLFRIAWRNRSPNLLRVIWRYASFVRRTSHKMRERLEMLLLKTQDLGRLALLKAWEGTIFGDEALAALQEKHGANLKTVHLSKWFGTQALVWQPAVPFTDMLARAYEMDRGIHARIKEGELMTASVRQSLTVEIPLKPREYEWILLLPAPKRERAERNHE